MSNNRLTGYDFPVNSLNKFHHYCNTGEGGLIESGILTNKLLMLQNELRQHSGDGVFRVLHIGNIANNAYLAARTERMLGLDSHVISSDYTHIMGAPEWEHCEISRAESRHFDEDFSDCQCGFNRPSWFHFGSLFNAISSIDRFFDPRKFDAAPFLLSRLSKSKAVFTSFPNVAVSFIWKIFRPIGKKLIPLRLRAGVIGSLFYRVKRGTQLDFSSCFMHFDIVNLYGSSPHIISKMLISPNTRPKFVTTEHGTLRDYIFAPYPLSRDTKTGYSKSSAIFVTNQDCLPIAKSLDVPIIVSMPHPVNDENLESYRKDRRSHLQNGVNFVLVPSRHSIALDIDRGKGNESIYEVIRSFPRGISNVRFLLVAWGDNVSRARDLLKREEKDGLVQWIDVLSRPLLKQLMVRSVCILDQFRIQAYGAVTVDGLGLGVPVITSHSCKNDFDFFGSCAPVFSAHSPQEITSNMLEILDFGEEKSLQHFKSSTEWYDRNLSERIGVEKRLRGYLESVKTRT